MHVYVITCLRSRKQYVGITSRRNRFDAHCYNASAGRVGALYNAIRKYGQKSFTYAILCQCADAETAKRLEQKHIKRLGTRSPQGYNLTDGGDGLVGLKHSSKTRRYMSKLHSLRQRDRALRRRTSKALQGKKKTPEHVAKVAAALRGKTLSVETRAKIAAALTGHIQSVETRLKRAASLRAIGHRPDPAVVSRYWKGRPKSLEQRAKLSAALKTYWAHQRAT